VSVPVPVRLRSVVALVPASAAAVADVGAGHGALAAHLALRGHARVVATEVGEGPLRELRGNLAAWSLADRVEVRRGDGLEPLRDGEVDVVVIAGLGAGTALRIAAAAPGHGVRHLVVQCMQRDHLVEPWLRARGWPVRASTTCVQRGRSYTARLIEVPG
jgi:tRNA (adenine22-N1)-methyltransferase